MTKLSGTSGQLFAGLAESLARGVSRSARGTSNMAAKSADDASFHDLLNTVSNMAKRALTDQGADAAAKTASLRPRAVRLNEHDKDEAEDATAEQPGSAEKRSAPPVDQGAKADVQSRLSLATMVGQELAAAPALTPQMQLPAADAKGASTRDERSPAAKREAQSPGMAKAADVARSAGASTAAAPSAIAPSAARPQLAAPQASAGQPATTPETGEASAKAVPASPDFEAVTANVERAVKASARDVLPEATKVTVVQQETHLPPVPQFSATQQVASAVVAELRDSSAPAAATAPDPATSQTNAPDQPLKILTIKLEPPDLGNVTVRLRLVGTDVSVQLAAERKDTSQMLDQQRGSIRDLMQSAGYVAEVAPVQHGSLDGFQSGAGQSQPQLSGQQQPSSQSQGAFGGAGTSSGQSDGGARQARQEQQPKQETRHDQDLGPQSRRGPVYL
jgi:chemotaxis protein MotD